MLPRPLPLLLALLLACDGSGSLGISDDKGPPTLWFRDSDHDGFGDDADVLEKVGAPPGYVAPAGDCDDTDPHIFPGAEERCNGDDDNCDGAKDEGFDADGDGFRGAACPSGDDCDDDDPTVYPGADEDCEDGVDQDCDGVDVACGDPTGSTDLADATVKLTGAERGGDLGHHMDVGDLSGDGLPDLVVGAMWASGYNGTAWVVPGPLSTSGPIADVGIKISGDAGTYEGGRTTAIFDVNDDGYDDLLLGAPDSTSHDAVLIFGPISAAMGFADADVLWSCDAAIECGHGGDLADVNGDGIGDAVIAAGEATTGGFQSGSVFVVHGPLSAGSFDLPTSADAELIGSEANMETGRVVATGGDLNGDGVDDIAITASYDNDGGPSAGAVYVVYGPVDPVMHMGLDHDGKITGVSSYDSAGEGLALGDVDGDGLADVLAGAFVANRGDGEAYVMSGPADGARSFADAGLILVGVDAEGLGASIAAGDYDGDGADDVMVGGYTSGEGDYAAGIAYLYTGRPSGRLDASDATAHWTGEDRNNAAGAGVGLGDLTHDGQLDLLVGATGESTGANAAGALYLLAHP